VYNDQNIEVVNNLNYLGMVFNYNGKFLQTQKHVAEQGRKALFAIYNTLRSNFFKVETQCSVNDMAQFHGTVFGIFGSFPLFSDFQLFSGLSTTDETLVVEMRIWCIKIGNVFALHLCAQYFIMGFP
jgi:hypothetical protein